MEIINHNKERKSRRKPSVDLSTMVYGKVPPQARELEEAVLGALMLQPASYDTVREIITAECFYVDAHQKVFKAIEALRLRSEPADMMMVVQELLKREDLEAVGGPYCITKLTNAVTSAANIESHARIIKQKFIQREVIRISGEMIGMAYEDSTDAFDLLQEWEKGVSGITLSSAKRSYKKIGGVFSNVLNKVEGLRKENTRLSGVPTGIVKLNQITRGWQPTDFIVLAARPSVGKSAVAANFARNAALDREKPTSVGIFSMEMSAEQWATRILTAESEIEKSKINYANVTDQEMQRLYDCGMVRLGETPIFIDDTAAINIFEFKSKARKMVMQDKVGLIIVDYLQLMSGTGEKGQNREQEISVISRNMKAIAKELQIPVIALSQLSRAVESRSVKKPLLSDLRESGAIEQDADVVIFLVPAEEEDVKKEASLTDTLYVKVAKNRDGALAEIELKFAKEIQKIMSKVDYDDYRFRAGMGAQGFIPMANIDFTQSKKEQDENDLF